MRHPHALSIDTAGDRQRALVSLHQCSSSASLLRISGESFVGIHTAAMTPTANLTALSRLEARSVSSNFHHVTAAYRADQADPILLHQQRLENNPYQRRSELNRPRSGRSVQWPNHVRLLRHEPLRLRQSAWIYGRGCV